MIWNKQKKCSLNKNIHIQKNKSISLSAVRWRRRSGCGPFFESHTHDFSDEISIKATYYAYYFSWLYSNFSESKSKQALECSIWKTTRLFFLVQLAENNQTNENLFVIVKTILDFNIFCCILVLFKFESECN